MLGPLALPGRLGLRVPAPWRMPKDSAFPGAPAARREDGGGGGRASLKQLRWSLPRSRGRSGSLTRTGKSSKEKRPAPASSRPSAFDHLAFRPQAPR